MHQPTTRTSHRNIELNMSLKLLLSSTKKVTEVDDPYNYFKHKNIILTSHFESDTRYWGLYKNILE